MFPTPRACASAPGSASSVLGDAAPIARAYGPRTVSSADAQPDDDRARAAGAVALPGGEFAMGTDAADGYPADGEGPVHAVTLSPFAIDPYAVTNALFAEFADATGHRSDAE